MKTFLKTASDPVDNRVWFKCPACKDKYHAIAPHRHTYNNNPESPTIEPSILVTWGDDHPDRCHSFITNGFIRYEQDCSHELRGQTIELPDLIEEDFKALS